MLTYDKIKQLIPSVYSSDEMRTKQVEWMEWYTGTDKLHTYTVNDGIRVKTRKLPTLKMASRTAEDWVSTILSENWGIEVISNKGQKITKASSAFIQGTNGEKGVLGSTNFKTLLNDSLEYMFAIGTGAIAIALDDIGVTEDGSIVKTDDTKISFNSYIAQEICPISFKNGIITEVAFATEQTNNGKKYDILTEYRLDYDKTYIIQNRVFDGGQEINPQDIGLIPYMRTGTTRPWFFIFTTSKANKIQFNSPLGESVYSDALDVLYSIDLVYSCIKQEVITGRRLVLFNKSLLTTDESGNPIVPDDALQSYFQFFSDEATSDIKEFVKEFHPNLNTDKLNDELQLQLNILSAKVGLGRKYYSLQDNSTITATEYRGDAKEASRNIKRQSTLIQHELQELILSLLEIGADILGINIDKDAKVTVTLRNATTDDIETERQRDLEAVKEKVMTVNEYRAKWMPEYEKLEDNSSAENISTE